MIASGKISLLLVIAFTTAGLAQSGGSRKPAAKPAKSTSSKAAPASAAPPVLLPSQAEIDIALKRTFGYDPAVTWTIYDIKPSAIPGLADVLISMNKQNPIHVYISPDTP